MSAPAGGLISVIEAGSAAEAAGLRAGDRLLSLGGHIFRDIIDYRYYLEPGAQEVRISRNGKQLKVTLDAGPGVDPGIEFAAAIFDRIRTCRCNCLFCFVDQLPRGLRKSLYLKDDDYRLSFLYGNFITLNNLSEADVERIEEQRLSPLYVSVHTTNPQVRGPLMGCSEQVASAGLETLKRLGAAGIHCHAQIVLCPGINDRQVLTATVAALADEYTNIDSVGIVPVDVSYEHLMHYAGISEPGQGTPPLRPVTAADCRDVIKQIQSWQERYRQAGRSGFVYAADEFYLRGGEPLPPLADYDDFPQYENGVGIAASFVEEAANIMREALNEIKTQGHHTHLPQITQKKTQGHHTHLSRKIPSHTRRLNLLTGTLAAGLMEKVCQTLSAEFQLEIQPLIVENRLFGPHVTVTGLLGGGDIISAAESAGLGEEDLLLIPAACLDSGAHPRFLDDVTWEELEKELPVAIWTS